MARARTVATATDPTTSEDASERIRVASAAISALGAMVRSCSAAAARLIALDGVALAAAVAFGAVPCSTPPSSHAEHGLQTRATALARRSILLLVGVCGVDDANVAERAVEALYTAFGANTIDYLSGVLSFSIGPHSDVQLRENVAYLLRTLQQSSRATDLWPALVNNRKGSNDRGEAHTGAAQRLDKAVKDAYTAALDDQVATDVLRACLATLRR